MWVTESTGCGHFAQRDRVNRCRGSNNLSFGRLDENALQSTMVGWGGGRGDQHEGWLCLPLRSFVSEFSLEKRSKFQFGIACFSGVNIDMFCDDFDVDVFVDFHEHAS